MDQQVVTNERRRVWRARVEEMVRDSGMWHRVCWEEVPELPERYLLAEQDRREGAVSLGTFATLEAAVAQHTGAAASRALLLLCDLESGMVFELASRAVLGAGVAP
jgi:hypothetical protein